MKRFLTVFAICAGLFTGYSAHAQHDCTWNSVGTNAWEDATSWGGCGIGGTSFPGGAGANTATLPTDYAKIDTCEPSGVIFSITSGATTFSTAFDDRLVREIVLDADEEALGVALVVSGDVLRAERLVMRSGADDGEIARLYVQTTDDSFQPQRIRVMSNGQVVQIKVEANFTVGEETFVTGTLEVEITSPSVFKMGQLQINGPGIVRRATITPPPACS